MPLSDADLQHKLRAMQRQFEQADTNASGYGDPLEGIEDDDYQCIVQAFEMFEGKKDPSATWLATSFSIEHNAELRGRELKTLHNLTPTGPEDQVVMKLGFVKDHFHALGVDVSQLDLTDIYPGSTLLNSLLDKPVLVGVYTNKKGFRNVVVRQRLDGEGIHSDLGTGQQQLDDFDQPAKSKPAKRRGRNAQAIEDEIERDFRNKPENCTCPDPTKGQFAAECPVPGHGIDF